MGNEYAVSYEGFYEGGVSSFSPDYGNFSGYRMTANQLGFPGSPQTANQLGETVNALKQGVKAFEVTMLQPDVAEAIPKEHFKEMRAIMKLSGVKPSVHGPMIDAAGFDERGNWGNGFGREDAERRMFDTMKKAALLDPKKGNVPVVFHSSAGAPGAEFRPGKKEWGEEDIVMQRGSAVNRETGQVVQIKREYKFRPERPEYLDKGVTDKSPPGVLFTAEGTIDSVNRGEWEDKLTEIAQMTKHAEEIIGDPNLVLPEYENAYIKDNGFYDISTGQRLPDLDSKTGQIKAYERLRKADLFLENAQLSFSSAFHKAYKYGTSEQKKELKELSEEYLKRISESRGAVLGPVYRSEILDDSIKRLGEITELKGGIENGKYVDRGAPKLFQEANEFAMDKAAETFGNLARRSYDELGGDKAPVLAIEPLHPGMGLSSTDDMIKLVKKSRKNFAEQLMEEKGYDESKAKKIAEDKIGVTWDVGHINMIKKHGFTDKDIVKQTKQIAPMVKHVHLTDNFGFADTHLAPGMGNVPIKKILAELEKNGRYAEMRKIVEAPGVVQHFKTSPHPMTLATFGSPLYSMKAGPYFNQVHQIQGSYFGGYGTINPQTHHSYFGAGFTTMPVELGGQMPGGQSRFGGTPMD
jgi:sugar phosphate isomerase/epimerase